MRWSGAAPRGCRRCGTLVVSRVAARIRCFDRLMRCALVAETADADLFLYPGDQHLFTDSSLPSYDEQATGLLIERVVEFLAGLR